MARTLTRPNGADPLEDVTLEHAAALFDPMPDPAQSPKVRAMRAYDVLGAVGQRIVAEMADVYERQHRAVLEACDAARAGDTTAVRRHLVAAGELLGEHEALEYQRRSFAEALSNMIPGTVRDDPAYQAWEREHQRRAGELARIRNMGYRDLGHIGIPDQRDMGRLDAALAELQADELANLVTSVRRYRSRHGS